MAASTTTRLSEPVSQPREDRRSETSQRAAVRSVTPYNGQTTTTATEMKNDQVDTAIATAHDRFATRHRLACAQRATLLCRAAKSCFERLEDLVRFMAIEVGGSDPFVVLKDSEVDSTVDWVVWGRMSGMGQSGVAWKRFIVLEAISETIIEQFREQLAVLKMGDSLDESTAIAPIRTAKAVEDLEGQVNRSVAGEDQIAMGGKRPIPVGAFIEPTLITYVKRGMPAYDEELSGPVASVISVPDEATAIGSASDTKYGLGRSSASVPTASSLRP